jgi:hypothetical protein
MRTRVAPLVVLLAVASLIVCAPASANLTTPAQAVAWLNAQREANGIPGGITDDPEWNVACEHHVTWLKDNTSRASAEEQHQEVPGTPGYTVDGEWAGLHSVLDASLLEAGSIAADEQNQNSDYPWGAVDTWEWAPMHLMDLLNPSLAGTGFYPGCMVTDGGEPRPSPATPELLTYPGKGTTFIYPAEEAFEIPFTPGQFVGIPQPKPTGPYLFVLGWGTGPGSIESASLTGPQGPIPISTVDDDTSGPLGSVGEYLADGGVLIPRSPLTAYTNYTASATFVPNGIGRALSITWSFSTGPRTNRIRVMHITEHNARSHKTITAFFVQSAAPYVAFTLTGPHKRVVHPKLIVEAHATPGSFGAPETQYRALVSGLSPGAWLACMSSGGKPSTFAPVNRCETMTIAATSATGRRK